MRRALTVLAAGLLAAILAACGPTSGGPAGRERQQYKPTCARGYAVANFARGTGYSCIYRKGRLVVVPSCAPGYRAGGLTNDRHSYECHIRTPRRSK